MRLPQETAAVPAGISVSQADGVAWEVPLTGRLILIAEDEPLIALDVKQTFEEEGAQVIVARTLERCPARG